MTQEEKDLLLKDLCARLSCEVKVNHFGTVRELLGIMPSSENVMVGYDINDYEDSVIEDIKPYLRPMSSMTEEEKRKFQSFFPGCFGDQWLDIEEGTIEIFECSSTMTLYLYDFERMIDWLNAHHFDYRGLIEKNLALDCTGLHIYD